jgi:Subtilase family
MSKRAGARGAWVNIARRAGILFAAVAATGSMMSPAAAGDLTDPDRAPIARVGEAGDSADPGGRQRVRLVLRSQPILRAAMDQQLRSALRPVAPTSRFLIRAGRVGSVETANARWLEALYGTAIGRLGHATSRTRRRLARLTAVVRREGGRVIGVDALPAAVLARVDPRTLDDLAGSRAVADTERVARDGELSGIGTSAVGAPSWWASGLTGGRGQADSVPADAAILSEAVDPSHPAFGEVDVDNDPTQAVTDHGTHTGGIIASGDATYPGVAPGLDTIIGSSNELYALGLPEGSGAEDPAEVISVSFGAPATNDNAANSDDILTNVFGVGQAFAAGNENVDGTPTVGNIGRNVLTVGGFNDVGTVSSADDVVLGISSRGPTPGGRKKPDLTAPGGSVIGPSAAWNSPPSNPDFTAMSGTSFAAPHVAGAMALLEGAGIGDPMAQRAILINGARDWDGASTGLDGWMPPQVGWRPEVGWGELDLTTALAERGNFRLGAVREGEAAYFAAANVTAGSKATLAYELRGYFVGFPDPGTQTLTYTQSNLDLRQYLTNGTEVMPPPAPPHGGGPDAIDPNDTVEQVRAPAAGPHDVVYKVAANSTVEGANAEPFAVAGAVPLTALEPAVVQPTQVTAEPNGPVRCGRPVTVDALLTNGSNDLEATNASVTLETPGAIEISDGSPEQAVSGGDLAPGETSERHSWTVRATVDGSKHLTVSGTGGAFETDFVRSQAVTVDADCVPPATAIQAGPAGTVNDEAPRFSFSATGGDAFQCSVDDGPFRACTSPVTLAGLADGDHAFAVRALDTAGNVDPTPARRKFRLDRRVAGAGLHPQSARIGPGARFLGSVRVRVGERGTVSVRPAAIIGIHRLRLRGQRITFSAAGRRKLRVAVPRGKCRRLRRTLARGRRIEVVVAASFEDAAGNGSRRRVKFAIDR